MPRIPNEVLNGVFFLFPDAKSARDGDRFGGCGFIVTVPSSVPGFIHLYGVTNWHVAMGGNAGNPVVRINRKDRPAPDIFEFDVADWTAHPDFFDIAVISLEVDSRIHDVSALPIDGFASSERSFNLGLGDDVFMVGRFVDHDGGTTNSPSVRFGNISVMPTPMNQRNHKPRDSYLIDMHSRTGYSGSPVFVYRTVGGDLDSAQKQGGNVQISGPAYLHLLGIHWSQYPEWRPVYEDEGGDKTGEEPIGWTKLYSGMTCVIPAKHILEVLDMPEFRRQREERDSQIAASLE